MTMFGSQWLANAGADYEISQSIRFNDDDSAHMSRTLSSAGNRKTWTFSAWVKRANLTGGRQMIFSSAGGAYLQLGPDAASREMITILNEGSGTDLNWYTTQVFRDPAAWFHVVWQFDTTQASADNRTKLYINGSQVTDFTKAATPDQEFEGAINNNVEHKIGEAHHTTTFYLDAYLAEIHFIDGTAKTASDFGEYNNDGVWIPKEYSGAYGTEGFYITGADSTALGEDVRISGDQVISYAASQYTGATGSYTYSNGRLEADTDNKAIRTADTFTGDFEFSWRYNNMANFVIGVYETGEDGTFSDSSSAGNMQNMTDSWYLQTSSVSANRDIFYGGAVQVNATTIADGDTWKMTRSSGTIKLIRNGSDVHTFSQTSTNTVRIAIAQGDAAADLGQVVWVDNSTLGNNFFSSGLAAADQMSDSPTLNHPVINPLDYQTGSNVTISDGNLTFKNANSGSANDARATFAVSSGKWYWEVEADTLGQSGVNREFIGIVSPEFAIASGSGGSNFSQDASGYAFATTGQKINNNSAASYGSAFSAGQYIGVALDLDNGKIYWSINGTFQASGDPAAGSNAAYTGISGTFAPAFAVDYGTGNSTLIANFGQSAFQNSPPTGFKALNTKNLPAPTIKDGSAYFQPKIYTGSTSAQDITFSGNSDLPPDWLWFKARISSDHFVFDRLRGVLKTISTNDRNAEVSSTGSMTAFGTDGFSLGDGGSDNDINGVDGTNYVVWGWAANGSGSSNEDGSINTTATSANTTSGFSINTYTGTGSGATVGHGLGVKPSVVLIKCFGTGSTHWIINDWSGDYANKLKLNETEAASSSSGFVTAASSTTFTLGTDTDVNGSSRTYVAYCFAEVEGYSSIGSYTGNGSTDGTFVYTGFKPAFVLLKRTDSTQEWQMYDTQRDPFNVANHRLQPNSSAAESILTSDNNLDFLSNGFKLRQANGGMNASAAAYIYMAFAENPFGGDGAAPATAR